ncbi:MAG: hypothetical protein KGI90_14215 [Burkholderiales bacterium]|nr:hypothetical protein [Burkholderiales bacterium]MDE2277832.1 hypothetical protein [Burkholderiales bacterium]
MLPKAPPPEAALPDNASADRSLRNVSRLWSELERLLAILLLDTAYDALRLERLQALGHRLLSTVQGAADEALFVMFQTAARPSDHYSVAHALASVAVADLAAGQLEWPAAERNALMQAGLTMNLSITALQSELAHRDRPLTAQQRQLLDRHPQRSAEMLREFGADDELWLAVVERHHAARGPLDLADPSLPPERRLADLLQRCDQFMAKASVRAGRRPMAVTAAVRQACLGPDGRPDAIGQALLRALGFYPPGTWVRLANDEMAVVLRRGRRADQPLVASLLDGRHVPLSPPRVRQTAAPEFAVTAALGGETLRLPYALELLTDLAPAPAPSLSPDSPDSPPA